MRKQVFTILFFAITAIVKSQTNTFPVTGNVGIGNSSPVSKLVISNAGLNGLEIDPVTGWNGGTNILSYNRNLSLYTPLQLVGYTFSFGTSSVASTMTILNNGNIGIGNASPAYKLVVSNSGANGLEIDPVSGLSDGTNIISYNRNTSSYTPLQIVGSHFIFGTSSVANGISLLNNGNVGIGTGTPSDKISIKQQLGSNAIGVYDHYDQLRLSIGQELNYSGNYIDSRNIDFKIKSSLVSGTGGTISFWTQNNGTLDAVEKMRINPSGNVGVGTTAPIDKLHVQGEGDVGVRVLGYNRSRINMMTSNQNGWQIEVSDMDGNQYGGDLGFTESGVAGGRLVLKKGGNVGIGLLNPSEKLSVNGNVRAKKIIVSQLGWPDYVFNLGYQLKPLSEVEQFIKINKHLPDIPSAKEVEDKGISVGDNQALLLKKIEELTLYLIEQNKKLEQQQLVINKLEKNVQQLKKK